MKAYVLHGINDLRCEDVAIPEVKEDEVLVKVKAAGICGSDIARVYTTGTYHFPTVPGHEFAGEVAAVGKKVSEDWIGKRVGVFPLIPCMSCDACLSKHYEMCARYSYLGSRCDGGFAEYVAVPEWNLMELPDHIGYGAAALLEPLCVALHAIRQAGGENYKTFYKSMSVAVCGQGTIGKLIVKLLNAIECKEIYPMDKACTGERLMEATSNKGVDIYFECVGKCETVLQGIKCLKPGGYLQLVGNPYSDFTIPKDIYWRILRKQLTLKGTWNSSFTHNVSDDWHMAINILAENVMDFESLISHKLMFDDLKSGLEMMKNKSEPYTKVMIMNTATDQDTAG